MCIINALILMHSKLVHTAKCKFYTERIALAIDIALCSGNVMQTVHFAYNRPITEYASPVWDSHTKCSTKKIVIALSR